MSAAGTEPDPKAGPDALDPGVRVLSETALADRIERERPVMVLFYADWCPFSEASMPAFRQHSDEVDMEVVAANLSHPEDPRWTDHDVETVPTLAVFANGTEQRRAAARRGQSLEVDDMRALAAKEDRRGEDTPEEDLGTEGGELRGA